MAKTNQGMDGKDNRWQKPNQEMDGKDCSWQKQIREWMGKTTTDGKNQIREWMGKTTDGKRAQEEISGAKFAGFHVELRPRFTTGRMETCLNRCAEIEQF